MAAMPREPDGRQRNLWLILFFLAITSVACSFAVLALVTFDAISSGEAREAPDVPGTGETPPPQVRAGLTYAGDLPGRLADAGLTPAADVTSADVTFTRGSGEGFVVTRYWAPVVALGAGVDSLTMAELRDIYRGRITDWAEVGGIPGHIRVVFADDRDFLAYGQVLPHNSGAPDGPRFELEKVDGYEALREAMTIDSGVIAVVPIEQIAPNMVAVAVDGADLVRGVGDAAAWPFAERFSVTANTKKGREEAETILAAIAAPLPAITRVVATGDVLQSRCSLAAIRATGDWGAALRGPVGEYLASAKLTLSSLDGSIQGIGEPYGCVETTNLTSPPEVIEALTLAGIDGMTVATNHAFDCGMGGCGSEALLESITRLNAAGIKTVGGGRNLEEALAPAIFEVNGVRIGVLGFDDIAAEDLEATDDEPGTAPLDDSYENERAHEPREPAFYKPASLLGVTRLQERIRALKQQVDVVIVQIQSGTEDTHTPSPRSIKALRAAADAGADLVVGNQAHWVQAIEVREGTFIAYALGNFIFDQRWTPEHQQGYLLEATFHDARLVTVRLVPYEIRERYKPAFVDGGTRVKILGDVMDASVELPAEARPQAADVERR